MRPARTEEKSSGHLSAGESKVCFIILIEFAFTHGGRAEHSPESGSILYRTEGKRFFSSHYSA